MRTFYALRMYESSCDFCTGYLHRALYYIKAGFIQCSTEPVSLCKRSEATTVTWLHFRGALWTPMRLGEQHYSGQSILSFSWFTIDYTKEDIERVDRARSYYSVSGKGHRPETLRYSLGPSWYCSKPSCRYALALETSVAQWSTLYPLLAYVRVIPMSSRASKELTG